MRSRKTGDEGREEEERYPRGTRVGRWASSASVLGVLRREDEYVKGWSVASLCQA